MAIISGIFLILEGNEAQLASAQNNREITWAKDKSAIRYADCSGALHYIGETPQGSTNYIAYKGADGIEIDSNIYRGDAVLYVGKSDSSDFTVINDGVVGSINGSGFTLNTDRVSGGDGGDKTYYHSTGYTRISEGTGADRKRFSAFVSVTDPYMRLERGDGLEHYWAVYLNQLDNLPNMQTGSGLYISSNTGGYLASFKDDKFTSLTDASVSGDLQVGPNLNIQELATHTEINPGISNNVTLGDPSGTYVDVNGSTNIVNVGPEFVVNGNGSYASSGNFDEDNDLSLLPRYYFDDNVLPIVGEVMKNPTGFPNRTDSEIAFDGASREFSIGPTAALFETYAAGNSFMYTGVQTSTIPDTEGLWHFYFDTSGNLVNTDTFTSDIISDYVYVANVYYDAVNNSGILIGDERHGIYMSSSTHEYLHETVGTAYQDGLAVINMTIDGSTSANVSAQLGIEDGTIWDEDIRLLIDQTNQTLRTYALIPVYYKTGVSGDWRKQDATGAPVINFVGGGGRLAWNEFTGGSWTQTEATNNDFILSHLFATNSVGEPIISIQGENVYGSLITARDGAEVEMLALTLGDMPFQEFKPIATIIYQTGTAYSNDWKARARSTDSGDNYVDWRSSTISNSMTSVTQDHGSLFGLSDDDHTQYILADGSRDISNDISIVGPINSGRLTLQTETSFASLNDYQDISFFDGVNETSRIRHFVNNVGSGQEGLSFWTYSSASLSESMRITGEGAVVAGNIYNTSVGVTNRDLFIDNTGLIGYVSSSNRYKENIDYEYDSSFVLDLNPCQFTYIQSSGQYPQYGLIAEDVELVNSDLVSYNASGAPETVQYKQLITPMLNEIKKLRVDVGILSARIEELEK